MKFNYLNKAIIFITPIFFIILLGISNQKQTTKIKILIWETPTLSLGKYLAISTGSGFILSFFITSKLSNLNKPLFNKTLKTKPESIHEESIDYIETNNFNSYDNTLIERDIREPSPTLNARFRVIGKQSRIDLDSVNNNFKNIINDENIELEDIYSNQQEPNYETKNESQLSLDWNDQSFLNW